MRHRLESTTAMPQNGHATLSAAPLTHRQSRGRYSTTESTLRAGCNTKSCPPPSIHADSAEHDKTTRLNKSTAFREEKVDIPTKLSAVGCGAPQQATPAPAGLPLARAWPDSIREASPGRPDSGATSKQPLLVSFALPRRSDAGMVEARLTIGVAPTPHPEDELRRGNH